MKAVTVAQSNVTFVGKYMYIETSFNQGIINAKLELSYPGGGSFYCLTFYYHLGGTGYPGTLNVYNGTTKVFVASGLQGPDWLKEAKTVKLDFFGVVSLQGVNCRCERQIGTFISFAIMSLFLSYVSSSDARPALF